MVDDLDDETPVTSLPCQWKPPKQRKESTLPIAQARFEKHTFGKTKKRKYSLLEDFDPRPTQYRGTAKDHMPTLLDKIRGKSLCLSLLFDKSCQNNNITHSPADTNMPSIESLKRTVEAFKSSLKVSEEAIRKIENETREQRASSLWYEARRYRLTASIFGTVLQRKPDTPPDSLVLRILQPKQFTTPATEWGKTHESVAITSYVQYQHSHGHSSLTVTPVGFHISLTHPYLGASPDGAVYDPSTESEPFGFVEVKCPYTARNMTPVEACSSSSFFCTLLQNSDDSDRVNLRTNHHYYAQVQGQLAIGGRPWCDFVAYTTKGINVQRIKFDNNYWENILLPKLSEFYDNCLAPEIVSPVHALGLPIRNLKM